MSTIVDAPDLLTDDDPRDVLDRVLWLSTWMAAAVAVRPCTLEVVYGPQGDWGHRYHAGCGGEVLVFSEGPICNKCNASRDWRRGESM